MKLDQTEKRGKKEEDRKKKEQESAEGISGLKSRYRKKEMTEKKLLKVRKIPGWMVGA